MIYQHQELLDIRDEFNLEQLQLNPSRENNNPDLFFTDHPSLIKSCDTSPGISDHHAIVINSNLKPSYNKPKRRNIYLFKKANWENMNEEIAKNRINHYQQHKISGGKMDRPKRWYKQRNKQQCPQQTNI